MAMAACYANYDILSQGVPQHHVSVNMHETRLAAPATPQKDYTIPLHVDCSVEYELPNQPKPPAGTRVEPLLMIHPCYFRKMESQRRSPFINNMPNSSRSSVALVNSLTSTRRTTRQSQISQQIQQQQMSQMSQQAHYPVVSNAQQHQPSSSSAQYVEQARRAVIHSQNQSRAHNPNQNLVQSSSSWDQIAAAAAVGTSRSTIVGIPSAVNITGQSMYSKPVGKRDAMLSGGCGVYTNAISATNNSHRINNNNNNSLNCSSESLTNVRWEPERSPMATVPSNYQAGPDTAPISRTEDKQHSVSGKYRQYLRSHRLHPYMMAAGAVGSTFPQFTATSFPQMQQVSCYNV